MTIATLGTNIAWYRGFEVRYGGGLLEFNVRLKGARGSLSVNRKFVMRVKGKPAPDAFSDHVRRRIDAYWFEWQRRPVDNLDAIDGVPWHIHKIHHHVARDAATIAFLREHEVKVPSWVINGSNRLDWIPFDRPVAQGTTALFTFPTGKVNEYEIKICGA